MMDGVLKDSNQISPMRICHLGPETPGLSMTFVYREAIALSRLGHEVYSVSVRAPDHPVTDVGEELGAVYVLYNEPKSATVGRAVSALFRRPARFFSSLGMLCRDMIVSLGEGRFTPGLAWQWLNAFNLSHYMESRNVQHLHVHFAHFPAHIAMYAAHFSDVPFTLTGHANDIYAQGVLLTEKAQRAAAFVSISNFNTDHLSRLGVPEDQMPIVRCGVALGPMAPSRDPADARPFRIGALGRLVEKKGMDVAIQAIAILKAQGVKTQLEIVGTGPLHDDLSELVTALAVDDCVTLMGPMPNTQVFSWLTSLDLMVLACQQAENGDVDGIPVALMEAMASGIPVVSTNISGLPELIVDGVSGLLPPPRDPAAFAGAIRRCIEDSALYDQLRIGGRARIEEEFSEPVNAKRLEAVIRRALDGRSKGDQDTIDRNTAYRDANRAAGRIPGKDAA